MKLLLNKTVLVVIAAMALLPAFGQNIATLTVSLPVASEDDIPVSVLLDPITNVSTASIALVRMDGKKSTDVAYQVDDTNGRTLHWIISGPVAAGNVQFVLRKGKGKSNTTVVGEKIDGALVIKSGNNDLMSYVYKTVYPPAGVDTSYRRSGFVHPLMSPHGQALTRIQPKDHYHHYGIWNPWTHTLYKGDTVDFWNIGNGKATVRFAKFESQTNGPVFGGFQSKHEHLKLKPVADIAMNEIQTWKVYKPAADAYIADFTSKLSCASSTPIVLLKYRYGGFGWRTTETWDNKNSEVITSEGKSRKEADGSKATWCIIQGDLGGDYGGVIMMSYPTNYNHPEPLRIWPENQYNRGDMFANFSPTKDMDWALEPGKEYLLRYRLLVFNGKMTKERAAVAWQYYAQPPVISVENSKK